MPPTSQPPRSLHEPLPPGAPRAAARGTAVRCWRRLAICWWACFLGQRHLASHARGRQAVTQQDNAYSDRPLAVHAVQGDWVVCVLDLVELDELAIELVAGVDAAGRPLSGASANEHADPTPWLRGGELLMMDGLELRRSKRHIDAYVQRIVAAGVAALAIGIGDELPFARVPRLLANACEIAGLPLVKVPSTTPFAQLSEAVYSRLTQERFGEAPMLAETQRALTRAAARPASSPSVVATLARLTGLLV